MRGEGEEPSDRARAACREEYVVAGSAGQGLRFAREEHAREEYSEPGARVGRAICPGKNVAEMEAEPVW